MNFTSGSIYKNILNDIRLERMRRFLTQAGDPSLRATYLGDPRQAYFKMVTSDPADRDRSLGLEAFGLLHRSSEPEEVC